MKEKNNEKIKYIIYTAYGTCLLALICMLAYIGSRFHINISAARPTDSYCVITADTFRTETDDNAPLKLYNELSFPLPDLPANNSNLIFFVKHEKVEVYLDSELIYSLSPDDSSFIKTTGANWCVIPVCDDDVGKTVRVVLTPLYKSMVNTHPIFYLGSQFRIYEHLLVRYIIIYFTCFIAVLAGLFFIIFTLINSRNRHIDKSLIMIGFFSILIGIWKFMDLDYTSTIVKNPVLISYTAYSCMLMMSIPFISFLRNSFTEKDNPLWNVPCIFNLLVFVIIMVLQINAVADIRDTLWLVHAVMLSNIPVVFIMYYREVTCYGWNPKIKLSFICSFACLVGLSADILAYYLTNGAFPSFLGITCLLFYIIALGMTSLKEAKALMEIGSQAKAFEEMAYHDQLTGLFNRTAYAEYTGSSNFKPEGHIIVMFDLNNLKQCNDSLGHDHGDSYIIESARLIKKDFGGFGNCYRIGGDEFCALLHGISIDKCRDCIKSFKRLLADYNAAHPDSFPLHIACGCEMYNADEDYDIGDTLRRADKMMYHEKFAMKKLKNETVR